MSDAADEPPISGNRTWDVDAAGFPSYACPTCDGPTHRAGPIDACAACGWVDKRCEACDVASVFDPTSRGTTCGGLDVIGAMVCPSCGVARVCYDSRPADALVWKIAKGGRSLTAGGWKIRAEPQGNRSPADIMARIVRVPELELEIASLRESLSRRKAGA